MVSKPDRNNNKIIQFRLLVMQDIRELCCDICFQKYDQTQKIPYILKECGHTFCSECLTQQITNNKITCAHCRVVTIARSLNELNKNSEMVKGISLLEGELSWKHAPNKSKYRGQTQKFIQEGFGECIYADMSRYIGEWKTGRRHGQGKKISPDGTEYTGEWEFDSMNGYGQCKHPDGREYKGEWHQSMMHGSGTYNWPNGNQYKGEWKENKMHGKGEFIWKQELTIYIGGWENDQMHGEGEIFFEDGKHYIGEWSQNLKHGHGISTSANGERYEGEWVNDIKHGAGEYIWPNGTKYIGNWENDDMVGKGLYIVEGNTQEIDWDEKPKYNVQVVPLKESKSKGKQNDFEEKKIDFFEFDEINLSFDQQQNNPNTSDDYEKIFSKELEKNNFLRVPEEYNEKWPDELDRKAYFHKGKNFVKNQYQ